MWELDYKESWALKNRCFWTVVLEKRESLLDCKEIQPVHPKGDQSWVFIGRTDFEAETPILWPPHAKSWLIGKDPEAGRDWGQEEKGMTEDEMAGWHHWLDGRESEWTPGVGDGQGGLAFCDSWGGKESDMTEWLNWTEFNWLPLLPGPTVCSLGILTADYECTKNLHIQVIYMLFYTHYTVYCNTHLVTVVLLPFSSPLPSPWWPSVEKEMKTPFQTHERYTSASH